MIVAIGSIVTIQARGSRNDQGETKTIPAIVLCQHPDESLMLWAFHFEGSNYIHSIPFDQVTLVVTPNTREAQLPKFAMR